MRLITASLLMALSGLPLANAQVGAYDPTPSVPRFTLAAQYNYIRANAPPAGCDCFSLNGGDLQAGVTIRYWLRGVADVGGAHANTIGPLGQNLTLLTYMGGPEVVLHGRRIETFAHGLFGAAHGSDSYFPTTTTYSTSATSFAYKVGGGFDYDLTHRLAIRVVEVDYLHTGFPNAANNSQSHLVVGAGLVFHLRNKTWTPDPGNQRRDANKAMHDMDMQALKPPTPPPSAPAPAPAAPPPPAPVVDNAPISEATFHEHIKDALFDYDSYALRPDAQQAVQEAAAYLKLHPSVMVLVGGYSDERGSADYNLALGDKRATAAREALILNGVSPDRIETISYGKEKQVCTAEDEACFQLNRRAAFMPK
ncbi:OmpA family protein [Terriglobus roseus]|uniref:Peptidoglycan-associated lipoprotein n=1 Tax=Terriglobus roseus TaxID=392734 RepID=A0A1H4Q237_9BACT|nr:OmpA family protein [Terriglobus roseus]SEC13716.1 peptidoglycan-associated lipoprotein [Terriglobus roseus]